MAYLISIKSLKSLTDTSEAFLLIKAKVFFYGHTITPRLSKKAVYEH